MAEGGLYAGVPSFPAMQASTIYLREDLIDVVYNLDKQKKAAVWLAMPKTTANGLNHEWEQDSLPATSTAGAVEGSDWASAVVAGRTRLGNAVQTFKFNFLVTLDSLEYSLKGRAPGVPNEYEHQVNRHLMVLEQSQDARIVALGPTANISSASATSTSATALMACWRAWVASASGAAGVATSNNVNEAVKINIAGAWSRTRLLALHEYMFGLGADPDTLAVDPGVKADITNDILGEVASATGVNASNIFGIPSVVRQIHTDSSSTEYTADVQFMRTDFGRVAILVDRFIPTAASATNAIEGGAFFLYERAKHRLAYWRPMRHYPLPPAGDYVRGYVHCGATLEVLTPRTLGIGYNVTT